jgi:hypothetical protein
VEQEGDPQLSGRVLLQHLLISLRNTRYQPP